MLCAHFLIYSEKYEWYKVMLCTRRSTFREIWEVQSDVMCSLLELFREIWDVQSDRTYSKFRELREVQNDVMCSPQFGRGLHILLQPFRAGIFYQFQFWNSKQSQLMSRFWTSHLKISKKLWSISKENSNIYFSRSIFFLGQTYFSRAIQTCPHLALQITKLPWWGLFSSLSLFVWVSVCTKSFPSLLSQARFLFLF